MFIISHKKLNNEKAMIYALRYRNDKLEIAQSLQETMGFNYSKKDFIFFPCVGIRTYRMLFEQ